MLTDLTKNTHTTTIMFTDIVGYGSLVGKNESKACQADLTGDALINVTDIVFLVNYILNF